MHEIGHQSGAGAALEVRMRLVTNLVQGTSWGWPAHSVSICCELRGLACPLDFLPNVHSLEHEHVSHTVNSLSTRTIQQIVQSL